MDTITIVSELEDIKQSVAQIHLCLIGNEYTRNKGLVDDVSDLKRRTIVVELFVKKSQWLIGIAASLGGIIGYTINLLAQYLITKH